MTELLPQHIIDWLEGCLKNSVKIEKMPYSHQDEVFKVIASNTVSFLKVSKQLADERDNLKTLEPHLNSPKVIDFTAFEDNEYLLISEISGKNLAEYVGEWSNEKIVEVFAQAVRDLHEVNVTNVFPQANPSHVLIHGDMALPNVLIDDKGTIGYIDFGKLDHDAPDLDLADSIWSLQRNLGNGYGELFLKEYGDFKMSDQIQKSLDFRYTSET